MFASFSKDLAVPFILRLALAVIFIHSGLAKITPESEWGADWAAMLVKRDLPVAVQLAVAWGELLGGAAFLAGFLTRLAALGILPIMAGAIHHTYHAGAVGFGSSLLQFSIIMICLALLAGGGGILSADYWLWGRRKTSESQSPVHSRT